MPRKKGSEAEGGILVNEYELERDKRIARNMETLKRLGLGCRAVDGLHAKLSSYQPKPAAPVAKRQKLKSLPEVPPRPSRVSKRLRGDAPPDAKEVQAAVEREGKEENGCRSGKASSRRGVTISLEGPPVQPPFTIRSIGTSVWALGEIYRGPWAQRYWSNPGCLFHHAYPIGYAASKVQFGRTYHMRIDAGPQGPIFTVTEEGSCRSFTGSSPTAPWTEVCLSQRTGQRISGPLYFGFSDLTTMKAIAALYNPTELQAALQGQRVENSEPTTVEKAAKEFSKVDGIGETTAMALALTKQLGGIQHASIAALQSWASSKTNTEALMNFLLTSKEMPAATLKWPAWRSRMVPKIMNTLCGSAAHLDVTALSQGDGIAVDDANEERGKGAIDNLASLQKGPTELQPKADRSGVPRAQRSRAEVPMANKENARKRGDKKAVHTGELLRSSRQRKVIPRLAEYFLARQVM